MVTFFESSVQVKFYKNENKTIGGLYKLIYLKSLHADILTACGITTAFNLF